MTSVTNWLLQSSSAMLRGLNRLAPFEVLLCTRDLMGVIGLRCWVGISNRLGHKWYRKTLSQTSIQDRVLLDVILTNFPKLGCISTHLSSVSVLSGLYFVFCLVSYMSMERRGLESVKKVREISISKKYDELAGKANANESRKKLLWLNQDIFCQKGEINWD